MFNHLEHKSNKKNRSGNEVDGYVIVSLFLSTVSDLNYTTTVCREDFYCDEAVGYCRPHCGRWKAYSPTTQTVQDSFIIMSAAGGIIAAVLVIILAYFRHKKV